MQQYNTSRGFALLDVFLAVIILVVITVGSYQLIGAYRNTSNVQTVQNDVMMISQAYAPMLNQTAITYSGTSIVQNGKMLTCFLLGVPIPKERLTDTTTNPCSATDASYSYIKTSLSGSSGNSAMGFAVLTSAAGGGIPAQSFFVAGVKANCTQVTQIIQTMNNSFGLFYGEETSFKNSSAANTLPNCVNKDATIYNVYLVSPKINDNSVFDASNDFSAP